MIEDSPPDLVVLDWMMPHLSGIELCRTCARAEIQNYCPSLCQCCGEEGDRTLGLDTGADDYMSKPFSPRELTSRVRALLRRARPALLKDVLEYEDLQLFPGQMEVFRGGVPIALGPKEYQLLSVLIERPGRVFSRAQLLDLVWGHGVYVEERTIDVHLSRLRKSLNHAKDGILPNLIRTVRGVGYALQISKS